MPSRSGFSISLLVIAVGCSPQSRRPVPHDRIDAVAPEGMATWRYVRDGDVTLDDQATQARFERAKAEMTRSGVIDEPLNILAISGGGADGAYGAGLLQGWSTLGTRPEFTVVTGISTGALTAPFAFLGSEYDDRLARCYTSVDTESIAKERGLIGGLTSDAFAEPVGLRQLLDTELDEETYRRIGEEHRRGRRLFIGTTNLDRMEPTYWCVSAIPGEDLPGGRRLFNDILIASASIPGVFPPVMIDVVDEHGEVFDEMHVDGGVSAQVFSFPPSLRLRQDDAMDGSFEWDPAPTVWVIRNSPLTLKYEEIERSLGAIAGRAISGLIRSNGIGDLYRIWLTTRRDGMQFRLASIPFDFAVEPQEPFDPAYMSALFEIGRENALTGRAWSNHPPGLGPADEASLIESLTATAP